MNDLGRLVPPSFFNPLFLHQALSIAENLEPAAWHQLYPPDFIAAIHVARVELREVWTVRPTIALSMPAAPARSDRRGMHNCAVAGIHRRWCGR